MVEDLPYLACVVLLVIALSLTIPMSTIRWRVMATILIVVMFVLVAVPALNYGYAKKNNLPFEPWSLPGGTT
jgi:predicted tellurium resistance membrane protein TerC